MRKKTIGAIILVLVVGLAATSALLLNNFGNEQNNTPSLNSSDNSLLGGVGGNGGDGGNGAGGKGGDGGVGVP